MKNQLSVTVALLLISTYSFADSPKCDQHVTKAAELVENSEVLKQVEDTNRSFGQRVMNTILPRPSVESVTAKQRREYAKGGCGTHSQFDNKIQRHLLSQSTQFPLASRVACDEIIESATLNRLKIERPETDIYASNQADFVNFGCGTAMEYVELVEINMQRPHATPESDDYASTQADRESRTQMIQAAREEYKARVASVPGVR